MPMDGQSINKYIGENQYRNLDYVSDHDIQRKTNRIATSQHNKVPKQLGSLAILLFVSVLSDMYRAGNSAEKLPQRQNSSNRNNKREQYSCRNSSVIVSLQGVYPLGEYSNTQVARFSSSCHPQPDVIIASMPKPSPRNVNLFPFSGAMAAIPPKTTTASADSPDNVEFVKLDYSCIEERDNPSVPDLLRKVANTLENTIFETTTEVKVLINYLKRVSCSSENDEVALNSLTKGIDEILNFAVNKSTHFTIVSLFKNTIPTFLRLTADLVENRQMLIEKLEDTSSSLINLYKMIFHFTSARTDIAPTFNPTTIPEHFHLKNGMIFIEIDNKTWLLSNENEEYYAVRNNVYHAVNYDTEHKTWLFADQAPAEETSHFDDQFYTRCTIQPKEGTGLRKFCRLTAEQAIDKEMQPYSSQLSDRIDNFHNDEQLAILERLDTGLKKNSPNVEQLHFTYRWIVYRIRVVEKGLQRFFHAIEIAGRLVPARAKKISSNHFYCEIYNRNKNEESYCVEFNDNQWRIEPFSSTHIAASLNAVISPDMYAKITNSKTLSSPDKLGIKTNRHGDDFLKHENKFIKLEKDSHGYFITSSKGMRFNLSYRLEQFHLNSIQSENSILKLTPKQYNDDLLINSAAGLDQEKNVTLNENWTLLSTNIKANLLSHENAIGSQIEVTFHFQYNKSPLHVFQDLPNLVWNSESELKTQYEYRHTVMDICKNKQLEYLFSPWRSRYVAAYYYGTAEDKNPDHSRVSIYDNQGNPLYITGHPQDISPAEMSTYIQSYFKLRGGQLRVCIRINPHVKTSDQPINLKKLVKYKVGFPGIDVFEIHQVTVIENNTPTHVFVTSSDQISLPTMTP